MATGTPFLFNVASPETRTSCLNTGTSWGVLIDSVNNVITFTTPTSASQYVLVATGTQLTISIGSNATNQNQGSHWITNPAAGGTYTETVGGTFGGSGNVLVSITQASQLSATVAETLTFTVNGTGPVNAVQTANNGGLKSGSTMSVQTTNPVTAGNLLVISADWTTNHVYISSVTDSLGNAYTSVATTTINTGTSEAAQLWYAKNIQGGPDTVTITMTAPIGSLSGDAFVTEYAGADTGTPLDVHSEGHSTVSGTTATSGAATTNFANDLIFGFGEGAFITHGSTFTGRDSVGLAMTEDKIGISAGSYTATGSLGISANWIMLMAAFKPSSPTSCAADDGASVTVLGSAPQSVTFGTPAFNAFYIGCQDLTLTTNAGNGYSISTIESTPLKTGNGLTIPNTTCDTGTCTATTAQAWATATNNGWGYTCFNQVNNDCASDFTNGTKFRQFANLAAGANSQVAMSSSTAPLSTVTERVKYRLSIGSGQAAGAYSNNVSWIATPVY
jgi:hypothetical protein